MIRLKDKALKEYALNDLALIDRLRRSHFSTSTEVCIERARLMTEYFKKNDNQGINNQVLRARAIHHYLSNRKVEFFDDNLLGGSTTSKAIGAPLYPEFMGISIWPELDTISTRKNNPQQLTAEEAEICNLEIFPYWMDKTVLELTRTKFNNPQSMQLMEKIVYFISGKAGCISHCVPDYSKILGKGANAIIMEAQEKEMELSKLKDPDHEKIYFYQAVQIVLEGLIVYAENIAAEAARLAEIETDPSKKENFHNIAVVCRQVPALPARNFREAVNALWLTQVGIHAENINMAMSPGRLDQVLYPFFEKEMEEGKLSVQESLEIACCLWLKIADNTNLVPEAAEKLWGGAGSTPAVTLGGITPDGKDAVNDLTYIFLKVTELMKLRDPSVNARYHYQVNNQEYRQRVSEVIVKTKAIPAFHNDVTDIATLMNQGLTEEDANDYAIVGCVELASTGKDYVASGSIMFNLYSVLELTLFNGRKYTMGDEQVGPETGALKDFDSFDAFYQAFRTQLRWMLEQSIDLNEKMGSIHQKHITTPLLSTCFDGPMETGKDLINGGAKYNSSGASFLAFPDVCDSLNAIEKTVFIDKAYTLEDIGLAVARNFEGDHHLLNLVKKHTPKFGTEDPIALKNSNRLIDDIYEILQSHVTYRGGTYRPAFWTMTTHAGQGKLAGATPNGRKSREVFSSGITPVSQAAPRLTEALNAVASVDHLKVPGGWALNIKYTPFYTGGEKTDYLNRFGALVEGFFRKGGMQVQFNVQDYKTLIDAKAHPEKYPEMIVRVSGYSAYFKDLSEAMKDELITRTQYNLIGDQAVQLPNDFVQKDLIN
jgi:formate C-acetyltransferase